ncbi:MAG TPA: RES family NAD+ phosphorylase [Chthoniobacterales bacterium]|nr:RES family NAD+ phosphorylase [Chthoniobacterales bacterium]
MAVLFGWRIVKDKHARAAFSGEGARIYGGRWNSPGIPVVYCSEHLSLASLEILVHTAPVTLRAKFRAYRVSIDEKLVTTIPEKKLPKGWDAEPPTAASMQVGDDWVKSARSAVLALPSVLVRLERTLLLNPRHSDFRKLEIKDMGSFMLDPRLKR